MSKKTEQPDPDTLPTPGTLASESLPEADKPKRNRRLSDPKMQAVDAIHRALDALATDEERRRCLEWIAGDYGVRLEKVEATP